VTEQTVTWREPMWARRERLPPVRVLCASVGRALAGGTLAAALVTALVAVWVGPSFLMSLRIVIAGLLLIVLPLLGVVVPAYAFVLLTGLRVSVCGDSVTMANCQISLAGSQCWVDCHDMEHRRLNVRTSAGALYWAGIPRDIRTDLLKQCLGARYAEQSG
jgi:hypothetical protein